MNIKDKLSNELINASNSEEKSKLEEEALKVEAIELFRPISDAAKELKKELSNTEGLSILVSENSCIVKLGNKTLTTSRYFFTREFSVEEVIQWGFPSDERFEGRHTFKTSNEVIEFIVKESAKYAVQKKSAD